jgi:hypothetical protein
MDVILTVMNSEYKHFEDACKRFDFKFRVEEINKTFHSVIVTVDTPNELFYLGQSVMMAVDFEKQQQSYKRILKGLDSK